MAQTEQERIQYEAREKAARDEIWKRNWAAKQRDEGWAEGLERGIEKGIERGIEKGIEKGREAALRKISIIKQINHHQDELGRQISPYYELFELPEDELRQVLRDLEKSTN